MRLIEAHAFDRGIIRRRARERSRKGRDRKTPPLYCNIQGVSVGPTECCAPRVRLTYHILVVNEDTRYGGKWTISHV